MDTRNYRIRIRELSGKEIFNVISSENGPTEALIRCLQKNSNDEFQNIQFIEIIDLKNNSLVYANDKNADTMFLH